MRIYINQWPADDFYFPLVNENGRDEYRGNRGCYELAGTGRNSVGTWRKRGQIL